MTGTVDVGVDIALTDNLTLDLSGRYNPITTDRLSASHWASQLGVKYWLYENFVGHFLSSHAGYIDYNIGNRERRYLGSGYTLSVSGGYAWILSTRWSLAVEAGIGICYSRDTRSDPTVTDWDNEYYYHTERVSVVPARLGVTFNYIF